MKKIDRYYIYIFLILFISSFIPDKGAELNVSFEFVWKNLFNSILGIFLLILILRCLALLISENINTNKNL